MHITSRVPTRRAHILVAAALALVIAASLGACSSGTTGGGQGSPSADPTKDKLAEVLARGTLVGYFEDDYPPQDDKVDGATRPAGTKCGVNQLTGPEVTGFDSDATKLVAKALGVEPCFVSPTWTEVTSGGWNDRWDIAYGSGAINKTRMEHLWMTQPYYYIPQRFIVKADSPYKVPADLDGKQIGTCTSCTVESYLKGTLEIPGVTLTQKVKNPVPVGFETEFPGIDALVAGDVDAFLTAEPIGNEAIKEGKPLRMLDEPAFAMYPSGFVDKSSGLSDAAFVAKVNEIISAAHADGTLKALSEKWFSTDYTTQAGAFDITSLKQQIP